MTEVACGLSRKEVVPLPPLRWRSDLSQAAKFHAHTMAVSNGACFQRDTCPGHCETFGGNCHFRARIHKFHDCGDDDVVFQLIGKGTIDQVMVGGVHGRGFRPPYLTRRGHASRRGRAAPCSAAGSWTLNRARC